MNAPGNLTGFGEAKAIKFAIVKLKVIRALRNHVLRGKAYGHWGFEGFRVCGQL